jgi:FHS family glucose/mannose:H+ symporter-like MFS transporter
VKRALERVQLPLIFLSYAGCALYGLVGTARGSIYPDVLSTFHVSNTEGALFYSLANLTGLAANLSTAKWYGRMGPIHAMTLFLFLTAVGTWLIAGAFSFALLLVGSAIFGFAMGGSGLLVNILAAASTDDSRLRRQVLAGLHACYGVASFLAPLIVTLLTRAGLNWSASFAILGLAPLAGAWLSAKTPSLGTSSEWKSSFVDHKPYRRAIWYASICTLYVVVESLLQTRLVQYGRDALGFSAEASNFLLSGFFFSFFLGRLAFALVPLKQSSALILLVSGSSMIALYFLGLYVNPWAFAFAGLGCSVFYPCFMALLADELGPATPFVMTWCQTWQSVGCIVMHVLVGALTDKFGLPIAFLFGPVCLIAMMGLLVGGIRETSPPSMTPSSR